jgi:hypothetical protein
MIGSNFSQSKHPSLILANYLWNVPTSESLDRH